MLIGSMCAAFIRSWMVLLKLSVYFEANKSQESLISDRKIVDTKLSVSDDAVTT